MLRTLLRPAKESRVMDLAGYSTSNYLEAHGSLQMEL